jgi:hypothetical protein
MTASFLEQMKNDYSLIGMLSSGKSNYPSPTRGPLRNWSMAGVCEISALEAVDWAVVKGLFAHNPGVFAPEDRVLPGSGRSDSGPATHIEGHGSEEHLRFCLEEAEIANGSESHAPLPCGEGGLDGRSAACNEAIVTL